MKTRTTTRTVLLLAALAPACSGPGSSQPTVTVIPAYSVLGVVRDTSAAGASLAGARVEIVDGPYAGRFSDSDSDGAYRLLAIVGSFHLRTTRDGYEPVTVAVAALTNNVTLDVGLTPSLGTLAGVVTESAPTQTAALTGARVQVTSGPSAGVAGTTDARGTFTLSGLSGAFDLTVTRDGYLPSVQRVQMAVGPNRVAVGLVPVPKTIVEAFGGGPANPLASPVSFFRDVHQAGLLIVNNLEFLRVRTGPGSSQFEPMTVQLYADGRLVGESKVDASGYFQDAFRTEVAGGARYEVRLLGPAILSVRITSPN